MKFFIMALVAFALFHPDSSATEKEKSETKSEKKPTILEAAAKKTPKKRIFKDELKRDTPRSSIHEFLSTARNGEIDKASRYIDFRFLQTPLDQEEKSDYARKLRIVLDRAIWLDLSLLSDDPKGTVEENRASSQEQLTRLKVNDGKTVEIMLQRMPSEKGIPVWKISNSTIRHIPELYEKYGYGEFGEMLAGYLPSYIFLSLELWQWCMLILFCVGIFLAVYIPTKITAVIIKKSKLSHADQFARILSYSLRLCLFLIIGRVCVELLQPPAALRAIMQTKTILLLALMWFFSDLLGLFRDYIQNHLRKLGKPTTAVLMQPATNVIRFLVFVVFVMIWFENMGFKATTVITGFGLGGLAVALAAQKSIENLIGAITLHASAPVKLGDFGKFGDVTGTIEFIGLRYTKIRTLDQTLVNVPNATFVEMPLESITERKKIRYKPVIKIARDATPDQIRAILAEILKALDKHPLVEPETFRTRFQEFGEYSLNIHIVAYMQTSVYAEFLLAAEELNLSIMDIIQQAGTTLAVPVRMIKNADSTQ